MFEIQDVKSRLTGSALSSAVDAVPKGHVRIETAFMYPDGTPVDLFLEQPDSAMLNIGKPVLTDFGNTWSWLQDFEMWMNKSANQKAYFSRILEIYNCRLNGAAIEAEIESVEDVAMGVVRLGQACVRCADLVYMKRMKFQNSFNQDIEDVIVNITPDYSAGAEIPLSTGNVVKVDFLVKGRQADSAIQTLSSGNAQYAHTRAVEINARWDDLRELSDWTARGGQSLTIYDDSLNVYDAQDLNRLERKSTLLPASDTEALCSVLRAA